VAEFADYDSRGYATLEPRAGYAAWAGAYEDDVVNEWIAVKPRWEGHRGLPVSLACAWQRPA
jgi:hypothetical protein